MLDLVKRIEVAEDRLRIVIRIDRLWARLKLDRNAGSKRSASGSQSDITLVIERPVTFRCRGVELKLVIPGADKITAPDGRLIALIAQDHRWFAEIRDRRTASVRDLARRHGIDQGDVSRILPLAFLAPDIVEAVLAGRQPVELTATVLRRGPELPASWAEQRRLLGFT